MNKQTVIVTGAASGIGLETLSPDDRAFRARGLRFTSLNLTPSTVKLF
jgi:NADP-dependent 3-hydroxy acid dehydrogenase YdfG